MAGIENMDQKVPGCEASAEVRKVRVTSVRNRPVVIRARHWVTRIGIALFIVLLILAISHYEYGLRVFASIVGPCALVIVAAMWLSMMIVAFIVPPPPKLADRHALVARVVMLVKAVWAVFIFAAGAAWGGFIGVALSMMKTSQWATDLFNTLGQLVWPIVGWAAIFFGWYAVMACAWDVWRTKESKKDERLIRLLSHVDKTFPEAPLGQAVRAFMLWTCRG